MYIGVELILIKKFTAILIFFLTFSFTNYSSGNLVGTGAMDFINLVTSSKSDSLGGTGVAAGSFDAFYLNSAALNHIETPYLNYQYLDYFENITFKQISYLKPFSFGNIAFGYSLIDYGSFNRTTLADKDGITSGLVSNESSLIQLVYSKKIASVGFGMGVKQAFERLDDYHSNQLSFDVGFQYQYSENVLFGSSLNNVALNSVKYIQNSSQSASQFRLGFQSRPILLTKNIVLSVDFIHSKLAGWAYAVGIDSKFHEYLQFRLGYQTLQDITAFSFGFGLNLNPLIIDFSYKFDDEFSDVYRLGFGLEL